MLRLNPRFLTARFLTRLLLLLAAASFVPSARAEAPKPATPAAEPRIFVMGHSFHVPIAAALRDWLFQNVYQAPSVADDFHKASHVLRELFHYFMARPAELAVYPKRESVG